MSVEINLVYEGELRCNATHEPSGVRVSTDAPVDNCGKGESFSPTDLVATALGACIMTILGIVADRHALDLSGTKVRVQKHMVADPVRRIGSLPVEIEMATVVRDDIKKRLENSATTCPVMQSLHPDIDKSISFLWK